MVVFLVDMKDWTKCLQLLDLFLDSEPAYSGQVIVNEGRINFHLVEIESY